MEVTTPSSRRGASATVSCWPHVARSLFVATALASILPASASLAEEAAPAPKVLRVATSGDYAPFSLATSSSPPAPSADLQGFDIEVAAQFAAAHGYTLEFVRFRWPDLSGELAAASFDVAMSGVTIRPERSLAGRFSVPIAATHAVALTWKGSGAATFEELDRPARRIAVNAGGHLEKVARHVFRRADIIPLHDNDAVRMAMLDRTYDAVVTDNYEEKVWTAGARDVVRIAPLSDDRKAYLLPADRTELAAQLDRWLLERERDGTLEKLRIRYFRGDGDAAPDAADATAPTETARPVAALAAAVVERLALMPMVYEAKRNAGKAIEDKEQEAAILDGAQRAVAAETAARAAVGGANATVAAPDAEAVRALFEALIGIGKDSQQKLADRDAKRRPGSVQVRRSAPADDPAAPTGETAAATDGSAPAASPAVDANTAAPQPAAGVAANASADSADSTAPAAPAARSSTASRQRTYDLVTELRPAIGRISAKIACILAAMDSPVSMVEARRALGSALTEHEVRGERIDALASAIVRISTRPPSR